MEILFSIACFCMGAFMVIMYIVLPIYDHVSTQIKRRMRNKTFKKERD